MPLFYRFKYLHGGTSLVVQRWRLHLPMQEVWVRSLVGNLDLTWFMAKRTKHKTGNIVINSIKILKMVRIKKILKKKKRTLLGLFKPLWTCSLCSPHTSLLLFPKLSANRLLLQPFALYVPVTWNTLFPVLSIPPLLKFQLRHQRELPDPYLQWHPHFVHHPPVLYLMVYSICFQLTHGSRDLVVFTTIPSIVMGLNIPLEERKDIWIPQAKYSGYWELI